MELDVSKAFLRPGEEFPFEVKESILPQDVAGEMVTFDEALLRGTYSVLEDRVHLRGVLDTVVHGACAMCMEQADVPVQVSFAEGFRKDADETEDDDFRFEGKAVSLSQMALTLAMLNLPMRFLCREGCEGSKAWKKWQNENAPSSHDEGTPTQRPFEVLQSLLKKDEEV